MHKIRLFPSSLSGTTFNWFVSLPTNLVHTWERLEQKFHDYFYNGETELRLSHLVAVMQKSGESVAEYMRRFRDVRNKCYGLMIGDKDLAELSFAGLTTALRDKMEGHDFSDVNQVLQWAIVCENQAKEHKTHDRFKEVTSKDRPNVNCVEDDSTSEEETGICVAEWVDTAKGKPLACAFLRPSPGKRKSNLHLMYQNAINCLMCCYKTK
jgi:hypothetical protein